MIEKCKTCMNGYPSISCVNCGTGLQNYNPYKPPTNADRIRSMNDDEMANWLDSLFNECRDDWKPIGCYNCINYGTHHSDPANKGTRLYECDGCDFEGSQENGYKYGILNWLKQPAKEEHHEAD